MIWFVVLVCLGMSRIGLARRIGKVGFGMLLDELACRTGKVGLDRARLGLACRAGVGCYGSNRVGLGSQKGLMGIGSVCHTGLACCEAAWHVKPVGFGGVWFVIGARIVMD